MRIEAGLEGLIRGAEAAVDDTYDWERRTKRSIKTDYALIVFDFLWLGAILFVIKPLNWFAASVMVAAIGMMFFLIHKKKDHLEWVYEVRKKWKLESLHWQAAKIEFKEEGYLNDWVFKYDA